MCNKNGYWIQLESNNLGEPTKYKCIKCNQNLDIIKHINYIEQRNDIRNRITKNRQKIATINLKKKGFNEKIHIDHLNKEIVLLKQLYL